MYSHYSGILAIALYLAAGSMLALRLARHGSFVAAWNRRALIVLGLAGVILHAVALYPRLVTAQGLNLGFFNALSLIGALGAFLLLISALSRPLESLGVVLLPLAALSIALMFAYPSRRILESSGAWQLDLHIVLSVVAYSLLGIAALQAIVLAIQDRHLRNRHPGGLIRALPALQVMESLLFQLIIIGFIFLSLALLTGVLFLDDIFAQHLVHKTVLSIIAWAVFGTLLWGRWRFGWRGQTAIRWTLGGFLVLMLAYFGSKLVLELILNR